MELDKMPLKELIAEKERLLADRQERLRKEKIEEIENLITKRRKRPRSSEDNEVLFDGT